MDIPMDMPMTTITITEHEGGRATIELPSDLLPRVRRSLRVQLRNQAIRTRFNELKARMKSEDALDLIQQDLLQDGQALTRSSLQKIVYGAP